MTRDRLARSLAVGIASAGLAVLVACSGGSTSSPDAGAADARAGDAAGPSTDGGPAAEPDSAATPDAAQGSDGGLPCCGEGKGWGGLPGAHTTCMGCCAGLVEQRHLVGPGDVYFECVVPDGGTD